MNRTKKGKGVEAQDKITNTLNLNPLVQVTAATVRMPALATAIHQKLEVHGAKTQVQGAAQ